MNDSDRRPDPDAILEDIQVQQEKKSGKLKIFLGYAAGVGKTYAMLGEAQEQLKHGIDVLVGYIEPHTRLETMQKLNGLPTLPPKTIVYRNIELKEFDLDEALRRKPALILVDELAHTNANTVRNRKRYQDIEELLGAGIDVYTTVNVQHMESLNNVVEDITKVSVKETIPDYIFDHADKVKLIDIEPDELLSRFGEGKIYRPETVKTAIHNFFTLENLKLLREISMRKAADRISNENQSERRISVKMANTKLLVCVSPSTSSAKCIRWAARASDAFHAQWTAIYIENADSEYLNDEQQKSIRANMDLASKLGAEVVTLAGDDVAAVISEYAQLSGITNIVMGKSRNKRGIRNIFEQDFEDKLISLLPNIEVHIIPSGNIQRNYKAPKKPISKKYIIFSWADTTKTLLLLIVATLLSYGLRLLQIGDQNIIMVYLLAILITSRVTAGYAYSVIASVLGVLTFNFFFTVPHYTFNAIQAGYPITFLIMLLVGLITSALTVRIKTQARLAAERERRTEALYDINKKLLATQGLDNIVSLTNEYIVNLFKRSVVFYTDDPELVKSGSFLQAESDADDTVMGSQDEKAVAHWAFINQKRAGAGTDTLMGAGAFYQPIISHANTLAVIGISCVKGNLEHNSRLFLRMITSLVAMALERQRLSDDQNSILVSSEKEKMRSNLLRAISHDLRTPLTGILGASSAMLENDMLDNDTRITLITNIKEDSQWLIRMVENLLSVTRIDEGTMNVTKTPEAAEEIVAEAVSRIRKRYPQRSITVKVPKKLLIVPMDGTLIAQVIINLLDNAIKHSPFDSTVDVYLKKSGETALFEVVDNGKGISKDDIPYLFESYVASGDKNSDASRGMGIGLSICMSIIKAHNGKMDAENRKEGGAVFRFALPLKRGDDE